ncbi:MAG: hypothetical protein ACRDYA_15345 [Egibacteraceae bacterium]
MIIASGRVHVSLGRRDAFLVSAHEAVVQARCVPGRRDFAVAADPIEPDRINACEEWGSERELESFRGAGPPQALTADIAHADVSRHRVAASGPPEFTAVTGPSREWQQPTGCPRYRVLPRPHDVAARLVAGLAHRQLGRARETR